MLLIDVRINNCAQIKSVYVQMELIDGVHRLVSVILVGPAHQNYTT